jgi:hypothetical protein
MLKRISNTVSLWGTFLCTVPYFGILTVNNFSIIKYQNYFPCFVSSKSATDSSWVKIYIEGKRMANFVIVAKRIDK